MTGAKVGAYGLLMWTMLYTYAFGREGPREKSFLGSRSSPRRCKFCGQVEPATCFRKEAHVVPAAFGNRTLFSLEECDECNERLGSPLESDLSAFLALERATARMRSRKGTVKLRHPGRKNFIESGGTSRDLHISLQADTEDEIRAHVVDDEHLQLEVALPPHRPVNAIKALARMALLALPDCGGAPFRHVLQWVRGELTWLPVRYSRLFVPGNGLNEVRLIVARGVEQAESLHLVMFCFSTAILAVYLPRSDWQLPRVLPPLPVSGESPYPPHAPTLREVVLAHDEVAKKVVRSYKIRFMAGVGQLRGEAQFIEK